MSRERSFGLNPYARWSFLFAAGGVIFVLVGISSARETYQGWKVDQEIHGLQAQVQALEGKKLHLAETLSQLQSPDNLDKEARLRLGLQKPGEQVFVLSQGSLRPANGQPVDTSVIDETTVSNPHKWFSYFFHPAL